MCTPDHLRYVSVDDPVATGIVISRGAHSAVGCGHRQKTQPVSLNNEVRSVAGSKFAFPNVGRQEIPVPGVWLRPQVENESLAGDRLWALGACSDLTEAEGARVVRLT